MAITGQATLDQISIYQVDADPTVSGITASIGSLASIYDNTNGRLWVKSGAGDTAWSPVLRLAGTAQLTGNAIVYTDPNGFPKTDNTRFNYDPTTGRLGLGLNAPASPQSALHVDRGTGVSAYIRFTAGTTTGQASTDGLEVGIDASGNAEMRNYENTDFRIFNNNTLAATFTAGGKTIIGASASPIDITGLGAIPQFQIIGVLSVQMAQVQYSNDTIAPVFNSVKSRGTTIGTQGILLQDDELGRHQFRGSDGVNFQAGASIRALVDGVPAAGSMPGRLIFMTTPSGATTPVERMRISQDGLVRIVDNLQSFRHAQDFETTVSANTTTVLTNADSSIQYVTGTSANQIMRLPDATTLIVGQMYEIRNRNTTSTVLVANNGGAALDTTPAVSGVSVCHLLDNSNSNGTWDVRTRFKPYAQEVSATASQIITSTTDVAVTSMTITPPAGTYRVTFDSAITMANSSATLGLAIYAGGTIVTNSNKTFTTISTVTPGTYYYGTTGTVTVNGSQAIEIRGRRSAGNMTLLVRTMQITRVG